MEDNGTVVLLLRSRTVRGRVAHATRTQRYGKVNEHNAWVPRDHWLEGWEEEAVIGYVTPQDKLAGRAEAIQGERERKLQAARERGAAMHRRSNEKILTETKPEGKLPAVGETDASSAGGHLARDSRSGRRAFTLGVYSTYSPNRSLTQANAQSPLMPHQTPGSGAETQALVIAQTSDGPESLVGVTALSDSR